MFVEHRYDVVIVGDGGAGLRAAFESLQFVCIFLISKI